jgi:CBS domain-containing protein
MPVPSVQTPRPAGSPADPRALSVADVMHAGVLSCAPETTAREIAATMAAKSVHCVVTDGIAIDPGHGERLVWGVVSDLDLAAAFHAGTEERTASALATTEVVSVAPEEPLAEAARLMCEHRTAHLLVVSESTGRPVGVISTLDLARAIAAA